jgi:hypothetical protein
MILGLFKNMFQPSEISGSHSTKYEDGCLTRLLHHVVWQKLTDISEVLAASIIRMVTALMMDVASTSETLVNFYQTTWYNKPEDIFMFHGIMKVNDLGDSNCLYEDKDIIPAFNCREQENLSWNSKLLR